ncbi:MAG: hypothetical protein GF308_21035 [Candidatus Heimdallarchaeota archaeon]|nr:hypothetical protein [Candidatus Heimdallarchaeota archaeon]
MFTIQTNEELITQQKFELSNAIEGSVNIFENSLGEQLKQQAKAFYSNYLEILNILKLIHERKNIETISVEVAPKALDFRSIAIDGSSNRGSRAGIDLVLASAAAINFQLNDPLPKHPLVVSRCIPLIGLSSEAVDVVEYVCRQYLERLVSLKALQEFENDIFLGDGPILPQGSFYPNTRSRNQLLSGEVINECNSLFRQTYGSQGIADQLVNRLINHKHAFVVKRIKSTDFITEEIGEIEELKSIYGSLNDQTYLDLVLPVSSNEEFFITPPKRSSLWKKITSNKLFGTSYSRFISEMYYFYFKPKQNALPIRVEVHKNIIQDSELLSEVISTLYFQANPENNIPWPLEFAHANCLLENPLARILIDEFIVQIIKEAKSEGLPLKRLLVLFKNSHGNERFWKNNWRSQRKL